MQWSDFYDSFWDWSDSTRRTRISSLEDIGPGVEVVDAVLTIDDEKVRAQLIRKAMKLGIKLTREEFADLDCVLPDDLYAQLGQYTGHDHNDPYFDEDNMEWDDFYYNFTDWTDEVLLRRINKLRKFGPSDEVSDAVQDMPNAEAKDLLYKKATAAGVRFTRDEMVDMGIIADTSPNAVDRPDTPIAPQRPPAAAGNTTPGRTTMGLELQRTPTGLEKTVVDIRILNVEEPFFSFVVNYTKVYGNGTKETCRANIRDLGGYYRFFRAKPIVAAEYFGKFDVSRGPFIGADVRMVFIVRLRDGSAELIQVSEGSEASLKLLQMCDEATYGSTPAPVPVPVPAPTAQTRNAEPYQLQKNELPQGSYLVGRDIPPGTYDFFVVYGTGGRFDNVKYDSEGNLIDMIGMPFWVGLQEDDEERQLIHVPCKQGYTIKIEGNVILKIAKSQSVKIDL